jgi:prevent-host-death family protein
MKPYSATHARQDFATIAHSVEGGLLVEATRRGKPVAVLLPIAGYRRLMAGRRAFGDALRDFRQATDLKALAIGDELLAGLGDRSPGWQRPW